MRTDLCLKDIWSLFSKNRNLVVEAGMCAVPITNMIANWETKGGKKTEEKKGILG